MSKPRSPLELDRFLPYRLVSLSQRISAALSAIYREKFGIGIPEWRVLANLAEHGELNPKDIARLTSMDKAKVSRAIRDLSAKRCVRKRSHEGDNRAYRLSLSERGEALYARIVPLALEWEASLLGALDGAEYRDLMRIIDKLGARLERVPVEPE